MNLFIDANILLSLYDLSSNDLEELRKLLALIQDRQLTLWVPTNLEDEYHRNRPKVVAEALKALRDSRLKVSLPHISEAMTEREHLEAAVKEAQRKHSVLIGALEKRAIDGDFEADKLIRQLLGAGQRIPTSGLLGNARDRRDVRQPPGKADSLGDAINWIALLDAVSVGEDVHMVSDDADFRSPLQADMLHEYLANEWATKKSASAFLYRDLATFSSRHYPELKLASDLPKLRAINALAASPNFAATHAAVARLAAFDVFSPEQAQLLIRAAAENSQVQWIATDHDVAALLRRVVDAHRSHLEPSLVAIVERAMHPPASAVIAGTDEPPF